MPADDMDLCASVSSVLCDGLVSVWLSSLSDSRPAWWRVVINPPRE